MLRDIGLELTEIGMPAHVLERSGVALADRQVMLKGSGPRRASEHPAGFLLSPQHSSLCFVKPMNRETFPVHCQKDVLKLRERTL